MEDMELTLKSARLLNAFLADPGGARYGLELMQLTGLPSGSVYPMLARFGKSGWLAVTREDIDPAAEGRPARLMYTLTAEALPVVRARLAAIGREFAPPRPPTPGGTMTTTETACCEHCDHDPGHAHAGACITCRHGLPDYDRH